MASTKDFYGESVPEALKSACRELSTTQDKLDISVLETGSPGIFGLCRKKAHIRVSSKIDPLKQETVEEVVKETSPPPAKDVEEPPAPATPKAVSDKTSTPKSVEAVSPAEDQKKNNKPTEITDKDLAEIREDLLQLISLMGYPGTVTVVLEQNKVQCHISGEHEQVLVGQSGKTLDSMQYLLGKITSKRLATRVMLTLDAGNFREKRIEELKKQALEFASQVKESGKTKTIGSLNPSERRAVHMVLQNDKDIRSRSVGGGLFKKVLIYVPGKGKKNSASKVGGRKKQPRKSGARK